MKIFNLAFISAFSRCNVQNKNFHEPILLKATPVSNVVNLNVGGVKYSLYDEDIRKHPGSFFESVIAGGTGEKELDVKRDGNLFKFVNAFMVNGHLPSGIDPETISAVQREAEFYHLPALEDECKYGSDVVPTESSGCTDLISYLVAKKNFPPRMNCGITRRVKLEDADSPVYGSLRQVLAPHFISGVVEYDSYDGRRSPLRSMSYYNLIESVRQNCTREVNDALHNEANLAALSRIIDLSSIAGTREFTLKPTKLVIPAQRGDPERSEPRTHIPRDRKKYTGRCVGKLEIILTCTYSGGEDSVGYIAQREGTNKTVDATRANGARSCMGFAAMAACTHVSVFYDIYANILEPAWDDRCGILCNCCESLRLKKLKKSGHIQETVSLLPSRDLPPVVRSRVIKAIDSELDEYDSIAVSLEHLYPDWQTNTVSLLLKGGDRALYDLLGEHYEVQVVAASVRDNPEWEDNLIAELHFPQRCARVTKVPDGKKMKLFMMSALSEDSAIVKKVFCEPWEDTTETLYYVNALRLSKKM